MNDVFARMMAATEDYRGRVDADGLVVTVGHGLSQRCLVGGLLGWTQAQTRIDCTPNTGMTQVSYDLEWHVDFIGQTPHLEPEVQAVERY